MPKKIHLARSAHGVGKTRIRLLRPFVAVAFMTTLILGTVSSARAELLDDLLADYRAYGLPEPPKEAKLVRLKSDVRSVRDDKTEIAHYNLAFLLDQGGMGKKAIVLAGMEQREVDSKRTEMTVVEPVGLKLDGIYGVWDLLGTNRGLATALQCQARGWPEVAKQLWDLSIAERSGHGRDAFSVRSNEEPKLALAKTAWVHWSKELFQPDTDRMAIQDRLTKILEREPRIDMGPYRELMRRLTATLKPSEAQADTPEALVDDVVNASQSGSFYSSDAKPDSPYLRLVEMGFEAVPALIAHLDDERLTRSLMPGFDNFPSRPRLVGEVASDILQGLATEDLGIDWLDRQKGIVVRQAEARRWFDAAKRQGEEAYVLSRVLPRGEQWPKSELLWLLAKRYPQRLAAVYRKLLSEEPQMQSHPVTDLICKSALTRNEQIELFVLAGKHQNLEHRRTAFWKLKDLDAPKFVEMLVKTLDELPSTPKEPYWECREASFANLVMETDDPRAWNALRRAADRADVGLRMEFMNPMNYTRIGERQRRERLNFLARFINDAALRNMSSSRKFEGPSAGFTFLKLEVRNFAAMQIATILKLEESPSPEKNWTTQQWSAYREKVKKAVEHELKPVDQPQ